MFRIALGIIIAEISRWAWHVSTHKTRELIIKQCFFVRLLGILDYKTLSYIPIYSVGAGSYNGGPHQAE
jgi:hypothetical protein